MKIDKKYHELSPEEVEAYAEQDYVPPEAVSLNAIPLRTLEQIVSPHSLAELIEGRENSSKSLDGEMFDCLTPLEKEIVRLRFIENLPDRTIAERVSIVTYVDGQEVGRKNPNHSTIFKMVSKIQRALSVENSTDCLM